MFDKFINTLAESGPLGILCGMQTLAIVFLVKWLRDIFELLQKVQEARIEEGKQAHADLNKQIDVTRGIRDILQPRRDGQ